MLKLFNAFQITVSFAAWPMLIAWLSKAEFTASTAVFWLATAAYVAGFAAMVACVYSAIEKE